MSNEPVVRVGIVGAGRIFREKHLPNIRCLAGVDLVAVANQKIESATSVADQFGVRNVVEDWKSLVSRDDIDAVMIGTWPGLHGEISIAALEAGKHVFCQRPMATDLPMAKLMVATADAYPQQVNMLAPSLLRFPYDSYIRQIFESGELGQLTGVDVLCTSGSLASRNEVHWRDRIEQVGMQLLSVSAYTEALNAWVGPYRTVSAVTTTPIPSKLDDIGQDIKIKTPQVAMILGILENGAAGIEYHSGIVTDARTPNDLITIHGLNGTLRYYIANHQLQIARPGGQLETVDVPVAHLHEWSVESDFIDAVRAARGGQQWSRRISPDFREGLEYMKKVEAVNLSAATSKMVDLRTL